MSALKSKDRRIVAAAGLVAALAGITAPGEARAATDDGGFFTNYLVLGPYVNRGGASAGAAAQSEDYLCDGDNSEDDIVPELGMGLGFPDAGGCARSDTSYGGADIPVVQRGVVFRDTLNLNLAFPPPNQRVMAYTFVFVKNLGQETLHAILGVASDDGITAEVNREEVINVSLARGSGPEGMTQDEAPVELLPGWNLIQFKVFQGAGAWEMRARLRDQESCAPLVHGDGRVLADIQLPPGETLAERPGQASRTIETTLAAGATEAAVTVAVDAGGGAYDLTETFDPRWSVIEADGAAVGPGVVAWSGAMAPAVTYRLDRAGPFTTAQATIAGLLGVGGIETGVRGERVIDGGAPAFVPRVIVTPAILMGGGLNGCGMDSEHAESDWISDGATDDGTIVPADGLILRPGFGVSAPFAEKFDEEISDAAKQRFWTTPGQPETTDGILVAVESDGVFDWERSDIFGRNIDGTMSIAYFYAVNPLEEPWFPVLAVGGSEGIHARVNGRSVFTGIDCQDFRGFNHSFTVALDPGKNLVAVYTFENDGAYNTAIRFEDAGGHPIPIETTVDPDGYEPDPDGSLGIHPVHELPPADPGIYDAQGFITRFLVPDRPLDQGLGAATLPGAVPEDYITIGGAAPSVSNVREGARIAEGSSGRVTTSVRGGGDAVLTVFDGAGGPSAAPGDPARFDGDRFYGSEDNYSSSLFFFLRNKTPRPARAAVGFASEDAVSLFVNGELVLEDVEGESSAGDAGTVQRGPLSVSLDVGINLVQLSYINGEGPSAVRVAVFGDCSGEERIDPDRIEATLDAGIGPFIRGDCGQAGEVTITSGIRLLGYLFLGTAEPTCLAACDADGDGRLDITTAIFLFNFLFLGGPNPPAPEGSCGLSARPSDAALGCSSPAGCS